MNRGETLIQFLRGVGGSAELGAIQDAFYKSTVAYSMTQAVSEARKILAPKGQTINCHIKRPASKNLYAIEPLLEIFTRAA
jgi:hypothetical protein